jgi:catechol 2,3-dioxygenase-like lactoylglutathione lyase family enzyme
MALAARRQPRRITHIGLTVPALGPAVRWYRDVLGFELLAEPVTVRAREGHAGKLASSVFGPAFGELRQAHLAAANGVALELFEFREPAGESRPNDFAYWHHGWFHLCVVDQEIDALCAVIEQAGGRRRTDILTIFAGGPERMCYCEDPFGNIIEVYTHTHERTYANRSPGSQPAPSR